MDVPLPHSHKHHLQCSDPVAKGNLLLLVLPGSCRAFLSGLWEGGQAAHSPRSSWSAGRAHGDEGRDYSLSIPILSQQGDGLHHSPSNNRALPPASFCHSSSPLLTVIPRQETAPCSQPNPLLGCGDCNAGSQPSGFTGLAGKAPAASLLQIQPLPPPRPLPEAPGFRSVGGSR